MSSIEAQLASLPSLSSAELGTLWGKLTGAPRPRISPSLLRLALAWEIQARAAGGLARQTRTRLEQLGSARTRTEVARPGMRLVRTWGGVAHVVTIDEHQVVHWDGRTWRSLSEVARAITGTRWSGPAFFGLKRKVAA